MIQSRSVFKYIWHSKGRHGIHSPFVFRFVDECLTTKIDKNFKNSFKNWIRLLSKDKKSFEIQDLGAGSNSMKKTRSIAQLTQTASSNGIYGSLLYKIAHFFQPKSILEFGTSIGIGSIQMKMGAPKAHLVTVEGCETTLSKACASFDYWKLDGITTLNASFDDFLKLPSLFQYDMVFIDGNHQAEATQNYINQLLLQSHNETIFILDDIRWSDGMWKTWNSLVADDRFHVSIDLGRMGLLWRREQQVKEHFTLRPAILKTPFF